MPKQVLAEELGLEGRGLAILRWLLRYPVPIGIVAATTAPFVFG